MAREPGGDASAAKGKPVDPKTQTLLNEISTLKAQLRASAPKRDPLPVQFETDDSELSASYAKAGGRVVTIVKKNPNQPMAAGKRYGFAETKAELEQLVKARKEAGL